MLNIRHRRRSLSSTAAAGTPRAEALASGREVRVPATLAFGKLSFAKVVGGAGDRTNHERGG